MADVPLRELNYLTPLEVAKSKHMDQLASCGATGLLDPIAPGVAPGSDVANLAILGYDPHKVYTGRGVLEAVGAGIKLERGDIAFRCDFATVDDDFTIVDERAGRIREGAADLANSLNDLQLKNIPDIEVMFRQTLGFKGVLVLRGEGISPNVSTNIPIINSRIYPVRPMDDSIEAKRTAMALNEFIRRSREILESHRVNQNRKSKNEPPANALIPWGGGKTLRLQPFRRKYRLRAACIAAAPLIKGICKLVDMTVVDIPGATGEIDTDVMAKARDVSTLLQGHDLLYVHVGGPDEASHDGDIPGKISIIEKIDSMVNAILEDIDPEETCITLLADHTTSIKLRKHTGDPTPIAIACADMVQDEVEQFSERAVRKGGLGRIRGRRIMPLLLDLMDQNGDL